MYLLLIFLLYLVACQTNNDKLIFVMTHFRHGARAPIFGGNTDFMKEYWEYPGELTGVGQRMHYLLGLRNRERYINEKKFLSEKFNTNELKVFSTGVNRTIVSVLSQLQGLYPQKHRLGEILNESQLKMSNPPININYQNIQEEITELNDNALPESMTLIPFLIRNSSSFLTFYNRENCKGAINATSTSMTDDMESLVKEFNGNYAKYMNQFLGIPSQYKYNFTAMAKICDTYIADYADGRNMSTFQKAGINLTEMSNLNNLCINVIRIYFLEYEIRENEIYYLEGSKIMELLINHTKRSIDADINNDNSNIYPKMLIYSGHDTTVSKQQFFLMKAFGYNNNFYKFPTYASQLAFEIIRKDDNKEKRTYSDYFVNYYFNDELLINITAKEFIDKVEEYIWSDEKINSFCGYNSKFESDNENSTEAATDTFNNDEVRSTTKKKSDKYKTPFIVMTCLFGASLIAIAFLTISLLRFRNNNSDIKTHISEKSSVSCSLSKK